MDGPAGQYPVRLQIDYSERGNRLTTFFRLLLAIPHLLVLSLLGRAAGVPRVHAHRFRHTFATWAIAHDARELDVQHLLGHISPDMVRRYSATYGSAQAAERHAAFSPGDQMLV